VPEVTLLAHIFHTHKLFSKIKNNCTDTRGCCADTRAPPATLATNSSYVNQESDTVSQKQNCLTASTERAQHIMIIKTTAAVISLAPYLTYKGEHTTLSKINKNNCFVAQREGRGWGSGGGTLTQISQPARR